jgi:hypothetical protein
VSFRAQRGFKILPRNDAKNVMAQVVGWANTDPTKEQVLQLWESYTQCHLDVGPSLQWRLGHSREAILDDPRGNIKDEGKCKKKCLED